VDLLSEDLRRQLADPKVVVADRDFVLTLDFAETEFQQPLPPRKPLPSGPSRTTSRRLGRALTSPEGGEDPRQMAP
jgi:hypothetical protein